MRIKLVIEYDGTHFAGFQRQPGLRTVDQTLEESILRLTGQKVKVLGAGRTDAKVHALGQVVAFDIQDNPIPPGQFAKALKGYLPPDIGVLRSEEVGPDFHPRYSAKGKRYRYLIYRQPEGYTLVRDRAHLVTEALELEKVKEACALLEGEHDFSAFMTKGSQVKNTIRNVFSCSVVEAYPWLKLEIAADGFLYHMVRNIVGTLIEVGKGKIAPRDLGKIIESGQRAMGGPTAPPQGLYLVEVYY